MRATFRTPQLTPVAILIFLCALESAGKAGDAGPIQRSTEIVLRGPDRNSSGLEVEAIDVSPNGRHVATMTSGMDEEGNLGRMCLWDVATRKIRFSGTLGEVGLPSCGEGWRALFKAYDCIWQLEFSPDGQFLLAGAVGCHIVKVWEVSTGKECLSVPLEDDEYDSYRGFRRAWFSANGRTMILNLDVSRSKPEPETWSQELVFVDTTTWRPRSTVEVPAVDVHTTMLGPDGKTFFVASDKQPVVTAWDLTSNPPRIKARHRLGPDAEDFNPTHDYPWAFALDGSRVADEDGVGQFVDGQREPIPLEGLGQIGLAAFSFSADSRVLAGCAIESRPTLWRILPEHFRERLSRLLQIEIADVRYDGDACVWEVATGRILVAISRRDFAPSAVAINSRGTVLATLDRNDVIVWDLSKP